MPRKNPPVKQKRLAIITYSGDVYMAERCTVDGRLCDSVWYVWAKNLPDQVYITACDWVIGSRIVAFEDHRIDQKGVRLQRSFESSPIRSVLQLIENKK